MWTLRKLGRTLKGCIGIFCARMFGTYQESGWNGKTDYHLYSWRGHEYFIPVQSGELH